MHYEYICSSWGQISTYISQEDFPNYEIWTRCGNPKGTDVNIFILCKLSKMGSGTYLFTYFFYDVIFSMEEIKNINQCSR